MSRSFLLFSALPDLGLKWDSCKVIYPSPVKTKTRSESRRRNQLRATFHCLSFSYSLSKCKCNERVLHLINVAMHVDTCFPSAIPALSTPYCSVCWDNRYCFLFVWMSFEFLLPLTRSLLLPEHLFVPHVTAPEHCCSATHSITLEMCLNWLRHVSLLQQHHSAPFTWAVPNISLGLTQSQLFLKLSKLS